MNITVTKASLSDADAIFAIEEKSFSNPWSYKSITESLDSPVIETLKAVDEKGRICGYATLMTVADQSEVLNIAVDSEYRRAGIGTALMNRMIDTAAEKNSTEIFLEVRESNIGAQTLYRKSGFSVIGVRKKYYSNPTEDAILMRKTSEES